MAEALIGGKDISSLMNGGVRIKLCEKLVVAGGIVARTTLPVTSALTVPLTGRGTFVTLTLAVPCSWTRISPFGSRFCSRTGWLGPGVGFGVSAVARESPRPKMEANTH